MANKLPWFTHDHDARNDEFIQRAEDRFGHFGYSGFFKILEIIHQHGTGGVLRMSKSRLALNLRSRWPQVHLLLDFGRTCGKFEFKISGDEVELQNKKFSARLHKSKSNPPAIPQDSPVNPGIEGHRERHKQTTLDQQTAPSALRVRFDAFWKAYPRKVGKAKAEAAWNKIKPDEALLARILATVAWQSASEEWRREFPRFVPHPTTWLHEGRWDDAPTGAAPASPAAAAAAVPKCKVCLFKPIASADSKVCDECAWCINCDDAGRPAKCAPWKMTVREGRAYCPEHAKEPAHVA